MTNLLNGASSRRGRLAQSAGGISIGSSVRAMLLESPPDSSIEEDHTNDGHNNNMSAQDASRPQPYPLYEDQMRQMLLVQQETVAALCNLNSAQQETTRTLAGLNEALRDLRSANSNNNQASLDTSIQRRRLSETMMGNNAWRVSNPMIGLPRRQSNISQLDESRESTEKSDVSLDDDLELERKQVRLDGLEVYAVVSAVTAGTLVAVFDSYHPGDIIELFTERRYLEVLMSIVFLSTGTIGIVCGLHCIFVFSLVTMYGRTALGMERDDALEVFFADTGLQRIHGFRTFVGSLYALMIQLVILITSKVSSNPWLLVISLGATSKLMYYVYADTQLIMEKAMVIFASPTPTDRNTMRSADSSMGLFDGLTDDSDDETSSGSTENKSARDSVSKKRATVAAARKRATVSGKAKGSTMTMAATEFKTSNKSIRSSAGSVGMSRGRSIRWSLQDPEDDEEDEGEDDKSSADNDTSGSHFISNALNKVGLRSRKSTTSKSVEDDDSPSEVKTPVRDKRGSLTKLSKQDIMNSVRGQFLHSE
ncbi:hypothetical protein ACHAWO_003907 [Cyclotella atomus]|uniref:Uncharacterized protein n=1 Tax=Cyclotella atomus TaxID=382360 RepID=A0ABD3NM83_9STRA